MIRATCPGCGLHADLDLFLGTEDKDALVAALEIPAPLARPVVSYLRLFSPPKKRLAMSKTARLLAELRDAVAAAEVRRQSVVWAAPVDYWRAALEIIVANPPPQLPLTDHNYLYQVVANLAAKAAGQVERKTEAAARQPERTFFQAGQPLPASTPGTAPAPAPTRAGLKPPENWLRSTLEKIARGGDNNGENADV